MSSSIRDPHKIGRGLQRGLVVQGDRIVGGVHLPPADSQAFLDQFNREYAAAGIRLIPATLPPNEADQRNR
jgi:hypothetical protein